MVTGGTGFIGGHAVVALLNEGHEPHLLVRHADKVERLCELHDINPNNLSFTTGDIMDEESVRRALEGCGACVHAAAFTTLDPAEMPGALEINGPGTRIVLDAALAAGCDPVIHISSISVVFPPVGDALSADDPVHEGGEPYTASKAECDLYARKLQERGSPVVIVYPGGVVGPRDLGVNLLEGVLSGTLAAPARLRMPSGGWLLVDVRDLAIAISRLAQPGRGPRRYMAGGPFTTWDDFAATADVVTGEARPVIDLTEKQMLDMFDPEVVRMMLGMRPSQDGPLQEDTGVIWRPFSQTLADLAGWLAVRQHA